jgi:hypothetical protein
MGRVDSLQRAVDWFQRVRGEGFAQQLAQLATVFIPPKSRKTLEQASEIGKQFMSLLTKDTE